jgi:hypothetical protein
MKWLDYQAVADRIYKRTPLGVTPADVKLAAQRVWGARFSMNASGESPNGRATSRRSGGV